ncbi:5'-nucleotidase [Stanieria cyanosphaera PCC 7437]|uniref:5'-nucleotidase SurE n=1 Tax=Stanieria cyanosphaera (strain ATCC 29371 / PCC 7437) TaxID=111780 RepID=K9XN15_STAC7|nr:5'/3'-nucleotidase SurE [Stanieria cyanosphaera]AFZ33995.1 5'-nucleotidase [Stanieria cyanosphaera PCC 7437]
MTLNQPLKILISNDDGIFALGVRTLANTLAAAGHKITVVCPDRERSATGHGLTLHQPIRAEPVNSIFHENVIAWSCSGTPADCVKFALSAVLDSRPDFVLSGINHGPNLGTDVLYSGTVSAAMEGTLEGIPSLAFSLVSFTSHQFQPAANFALKLLQRLAIDRLPQATLLSINIPAVAETELAGVMVTRQGLRRYIEKFEKRLDPRGKNYYWLVGEIIEDIEQPEDSSLPPHIMTDVQAIRDRYITITPLRYNLTDSMIVQHLYNLNWFSEPY